MPGQPRTRSKKKNLQVNPKAEAERMFHSLGKTEPITDPILALEELAGQAKALVDSLQAVVTKLRTIRYRDERGAEQLRGELTVYLAAIAQAESILGRIVVLDLDERRVRVVERRRAMEDEVARQMVESQVAFIADLGLKMSDPKVHYAIERLRDRWRVEHSEVVDGEVLELEAPDE